jgi:hypothetical protein
LILAIMYQRTNFESMLKVILSAILILSIHACDLTDDNLTASQPIYFEYSYINFAWGYQHNGWIIDGDGNIKLYNLPDNWTETDSTGFIQEDDLLFNIDQTDSIVGVVDSTELMEKAALIPGAKNGKITSPVNIAADAGNATLYGYYYNSDEEAYEKVFLATSGDFSSHNQSDEAKELVAWLRSFGVFWLSP